MSQCRASKPNGERCRLPSKGSEGYCWTHDPKTPSVAARRLLEAVEPRLIRRYEGRRPRYASWSGSSKTRTSMSARRTPSTVCIRPSCSTSS
jgi:hypothetical protein